MPTIRQDRLDALLKQIPADKHDMMRQIIQDLHQVVCKIEGRPPTTKDCYGDYLPHCKDTITCSLLIIAGANQQGVEAAARINGVDL